MLVDLLRYEFIDLELVQGVVVALDNLPEGWHLFDLEPARHKLCHFLDLADPVLPVNKLACLLVTQLPKEHVQLHGAGTSHLEGIPDLVSHVGQRLLPLPMLVIIDSLLCLLLSLSDFVLDFFNHAESLDG